MIDLIKGLYCLAEKELNSNRKKEIQLRAHNLAHECVNLQPNTYLSQKWFAITTGRIVDYLGVNEKVKSGFEFKKHLDIAIDLNENDYMLYYLRGRWIHRICNLNWAEKYAAQFIFGKVPDVKLDDALSDFLKCESLNVKTKLKGNLLYLSKCYIEKKEISTAIRYLKEALAIPNKTPEHELDNKEIETLIKKYS